VNQQGTIINGDLQISGSGSSGEQRDGVTQRVCRMTFLVRMKIVLECAWQRTHTPTPGSARLSRGAPGHRPLNQQQLLCRSSPSCEPVSQDASDLLTRTIVAQLLRRRAIQGWQAKIAMQWTPSRAGRGLNDLIEHQIIEPPRLWRQRRGLRCRSRSSLDHGLSHLLFAARNKIHVKHHDKQ